MLQGGNVEEETATVSCWMKSCRQQQNSTPPTLHQQRLLPCSSVVWNVCDHSHTKNWILGFIKPHKHHFFGLNQSGRVDFVADAAKLCESLTDSLILKLFCSVFVNMSSVWFCSQSSDGFRTADSGSIWCSLSSHSVHLSLSPQTRLLTVTMCVLLWYVILCDLE